MSLDWENPAPSRIRKLAAGSDIVKAPHSNHCAMSLSMKIYISFFCYIWTIISMYRVHHPNLATGRYLCCPPKVWAFCASTSWQDRWRQVKEQTWLDQASDIILNSLHLDTEDTLNWAGFMASLLRNDRPNIKPNAIIGVMPLWQDSIYTNGETYMIIGKCVTEFLNPRWAFHWYSSARGGGAGLHAEIFAAVCKKYSPGGDNGSWPTTDQQMVTIVIFCEEGLTAELDAPQPRQRGLLAGSHQSEQCPWR